MRVGYARVSRQDQRLEPQRDALLADGCNRVFEEKVSSRKVDRKALRKAFDFCCSRTSRDPFSIRLLTCLYRRASAALPSPYFFRCLQDLLERRDPDSNRGHHDFQSYSEALRYATNRYR